MIDDLFELARLDAGAQLDRRPLLLTEIAAEVVDAMQAQAQRASVTLTLAVEAAVPPLSLDGARMERVIANLLRNAMEHTSEGGHVAVRVGVEEGWARLSVTDDGEGLAAEDLPRIWDRFYRAEKSRTRGAIPADGAGLGLSIVRGIVEAHGGTVDVKSARGAGATFSVSLPLSAQPSRNP
jgi:two-component system sensor histidine kinase BaeS